jgi:multiple sugar transport system permease protein
MELSKGWNVRKKRQLEVIIAFTIVPLFLLILFTYYPFMEMIRYSFYNMKYIGPRKFVGWRNYITVFTRPDIIRTLLLSLYYMVGSVVQVALALYLATIFCFKVKGENLWKGFIFFPYLINGIAIGFIFKFFYTRGFVLDTVLQAIGFDLENLPYWLKDQSINNWSLVFTSVWRYMGSNMVLFLGAMMAVDSTLYEAASLDGANKWQTFRHIILPSIKTIVTLNIILSITGSLSAFEPPYVITSGANGTATFFVVMNDIAHTSQKVGLASAMAVFLLLVIFIAKFLQDALFKYIFRNADTGDESADVARQRKKARKAAERAAKGGK